MKPRFLIIFSQRRALRATDIVSKSTAESMRLSVDQQEDGFENLVGDGDDGALVSSSQAQGLEFRL